MSKLNTQEIMQIIPHRYPFLMVDVIEELEEGRRAVGRKAVSVGEPCFQGHFPGEPVMPGVLIVEALAQVGAVALLSLEEYRGKTAYFAGIQNARFKKKVVPGDVLRLETELIKRKGPVGIGVGKAYVGETLVAQAELTFAVGEEKQAEEKRS